MGFYDPETGSTTKKKSNIFIAVSSAIIGGLIAVMLIPLMAQNGMLNFYPSSTLDLTGPTKTTNVKVNSQITEAVKKVMPAVVGVINIKNVEDPFYPQQEVPQGTGSGFIIDRAGGKAHIVTNHHVIAGSTEVKVVIPNQKNIEIPAKVIGSDAYTDIAVLEISDQHVKAVTEWGNSDTLQAGEPAIAIGNPLGLEASVTAGIISSPKRTIEIDDASTSTVIQTDAAINPGNSGGPLVNAAGQVIGINRLKISDKGVEGLGFAIPANQARVIINSLLRYGYVPHAYMGIVPRDLNHYPPSVREYLKLPVDVKGGVIVVKVNEGTPAVSAGLAKKDVIVALDGKPVTSVAEIHEYLYAEDRIGKKIKVTYYRNGKKQETSLTLAKAPTEKE